MNYTFSREKLGPRLIQSTWQCFKYCYDGPCRIQLIGLQSKSIDPFLCDRSSHFVSRVKIWWKNSKPMVASNGWWPVINGHFCIITDQLFWIVRWNLLEYWLSNFQFCMKVKPRNYYRSIVRISAASLLGIIGNILADVMQILYFSPNKLLKHAITETSHFSSRK